LFPTVKCLTRRLALGRSVGFRLRTVSEVSKTADKNGQHGRQNGQNGGRFEVQNEERRSRGLGRSRVEIARLRRSWVCLHCEKRRSRSGLFNTPFALNASVLLAKAVSEPRAENSAFHLPAHHVTSPDTSRGETQHARLKSVQSQNAHRRKPEFPALGSETQSRCVQGERGVKSNNDAAVFCISTGTKLQYSTADGRPTYHIFQSDAFKSVLIV
jgi:hypothetical protein